MLSEKQQREVERLIPYAGKIAYSFSPSEDYQQEAFLALCIAVEKFDKERGVPIDQFAGLCIRNHLLKVRRRESHNRLYSLGTNLPDRRDMGQRATELHRIIDALPSSLRFVAQARWVDRKKTSEIASFLGLTVEATRDIINDARLAVKSGIDDSVISFNEDYLG